MYKKQSHVDCNKLKLVKRMQITLEKQANNSKNQEGLMKRVKMNKRNEKKNH